jgi:hypothetical protein
MPAVAAPGHDLAGTLHLLETAEACRWHMADIPWDGIDDSLVDDELIGYVRRAALTEMTTWEATQRFMTAFADDVDFTQWIAVWFYEETKHPQALMRWLDHFGVSLPAGEMLSARETQPFVESRAGTLAINVIAETIASAGYQRLASVSTEPVLRTIATNLARDEGRHASGFYVFLDRELRRSGQPDRERRKILMILYMWFRHRAGMKHPGMLLHQELTTETRDDPEELAEAPHIVTRLCGLFAEVLDEPGLRAPGDLPAILRRGTRRGGRRFRPTPA